MKILVINSGSSSVKYDLIDTETHKEITRGLIEKIGLKEQIHHYCLPGGEKAKDVVNAPNHKVALSIITKHLTDPVKGFLKSIDEIAAVGHRVVHGGEKFAGSYLITDEVIKSIERFSELAPLHNPPNLEGIMACRELLPNVPQVAVFDTAFHQTMPEEVFLYAIPYEYYKKYGIRRYGFHGTSHKFVAQKAAEMLGKKFTSLNIITAHLGNGASITAIRKGKSVDTSMGFTPLEGLIMGTRSGDLDPAIVFFLMEKEDLSPNDVNNILNKKSGLLGISGISNDVRTIMEEAERGDRRAILALNMFCYRIKKYIGAYWAVLGELDAIVFTAGIGENSWQIREKALAGLEPMGIKVDKKKNQSVVGGVAGEISTEDSRVKVLVIPTNEELAIALDTGKIVSELNKKDKS